MLSHLCSCPVFNDKAVCQSHCVPQIKKDLKLQCECFVLTLEKGKIGGDTLTGTSEDQTLNFLQSFCINLVGNLLNYVKETPF